MDRSIPLQGLLELSARQATCVTALCLFMHTHSRFTCHKIPTHYSDEALPTVLPQNPWADTRRRTLAIKRTDRLTKETAFCLSGRDERCQLVIVWNRFSAALHPVKYIPQFNIPFTLPRHRASSPAKTQTNLFDLLRPFCPITKPDSPEAESLWLRGNERKRLSVAQCTTATTKCSYLVGENIGWA